MQLLIFFLRKFEITCLPVYSYLLQSTWIKWHFVGMVHERFRVKTSSPGPVMPVFVLGLKTNESLEDDLLKQTKYLVEGWRRNEPGGRRVFFYTLKVVERLRTAANPSARGRSAAKGEGPAVRYCYLYLMGVTVIGGPKRRCTVAAQS